MRSRSIRSALAMIGFIQVGLSAPAQVLPQWEELVTDPLTTHVAGKSIVPRGASGEWYVAGHAYTDSPSIPTIVYYEFAPLIQRLDASGQAVWSLVQPLGFTAFAGPVALASDSLGDARFAWSASSSGVRLQRLSATDGAVIWDSQGPANSLKVVPDSLLVLGNSQHHLGVVFTNEVGYAVYGGTGVLQQGVLVPGAPPGSYNVGATHAGTQRISVAASASGQGGLIFVVASDGSLAWSITSVDFFVNAIALGPGGVLSAVGVDGAGFPRLRLFDANGTQIGDHQLTSAPNSQWQDVEFDAWGGVVAVGNIGSDASIAKFTPQGALEWQRTWTGPSGFTDTFTRVLAPSSGEFVAAGKTDLNAAEPYYLHEQQLLLTGWRRNGDFAWEHRDPTEGTVVESCNALAEAPFFGSVLSVGTRSAQAWVNPGYIPNGVHVLSLRPQASAFCFGDATSTSLCPCGNFSPAGAQQGCLNSTGAGARLTDSGLASLAADTLMLTVTGVPTASSCLVFQSTTRGGVTFGDGLRCVLGSPVIRLYTVQATGGVASVPPPGGSIAARSAAAGDPLVAGAARWVQTYYRNSDPNFCVPTAGFNASSALTLTWAP